MRALLHLPVLCLMLLAGGAWAADKPNILFIMSDDVGISNVSAYRADA